MSRLFEAFGADFRGFDEDLGGKVRHLGRFEGVSCSRIGIIEPQLGKVRRYVILSSNYLVGWYPEVFPR